MGVKVFGRGGKVEVRAGGMREREREGASTNGRRRKNGKRKKKKKRRPHLRVKVHWRALQPDPLGLDLVGSQREVPCVFLEEIVIRTEREREGKKAR